jgi:hypothetical protein
MNYPLESLGVICATSQWAWKRFLTAKARRPRRREEMKKTRKEIEPIAEFAVDAMLKVHRALGPGLLESAYQACLALRALRAFAVNLASYREIRG